MDRERVTFIVRTIIHLPEWPDGTGMRPQEQFSSDNVCSWKSIESEDCRSERLAPKRYRTEGWRAGGRPQVNAHRNIAKGHRPKPTPLGLIKKALQLPICW